MKKKMLSENGQTLLDVSQGDIRITENGATGGGLSQNETSLNPKGYWITGTTTSNNIEVLEGVETDIFLDNVSITIGEKDTTTSKWDCINVSHADVTITLVGENRLTCNSGSSADGMSKSTGAALAKDGMDGTLTIQCEYAGVEGHRCNSFCGSLLAEGNPDIWHVGAIGSTLRNAADKKNCGFSNLTIKGGNIEAYAGFHTAGIGSACISEASGGYTSNIRISGGNIKATGTDKGSGIGSGYGNTVDGIYISGGYVEAQGGANAPGIGASYGGGNMDTKNIQISGGDTVVVAIGDEATSMPGIGSAGGNGKVSNVTAAPDFGYQGYIQDGTSLTDYTFVDGTPFKEDTSIQVGKFYTKVYFGPFRDTNQIEKDTKEQIGANHVISKTGGEAFTKEQLKGLTKVTGKQENGTDFSVDDLRFESPDQIEAINKAKAEKKLGEYPLMFTTPNGTKTAVKVYLKAEGTDAAKVDPKHLEVTIGANSFSKETGGLALTADDVRTLASVQGKDAEGTTYKDEHLIPNEKELKAINEAKTAGKAGKFDLTFTSPDKKSVMITVSLHGEYDEIVQDADSGEMIKAKHIISRTSGAPFTKEQLKELSRVKAVAGDDSVIETVLITFPKQEQIEKLNAAKASKKTGEFELTFAAPDGTEATVTVYLTEEGLDGAAQGSGKPSCGADSVSRPTGGNGFGEEELTELCRAKGKDENGDNAVLKIDEEQLLKLNRAKAAGKTGSFDVTFSMEDGTKVKVAVALTGEHTVTFDADGGKDAPAVQTVTGGKEARQPEEPEKAGYLFEGWYYTDEEGNEVKWNFGTPVHENLNLKAKWKKKAEVTTSKEETTTAAKKPEKPKEQKKAREKKPKKKTKTNWNYKEVAERRAQQKTGEGWKTAEEGTAQTGEESKILWIICCMAGAAGMMICVVRRRKKQR